MKKVLYLVILIIELVACSKSSEGVDINNPNNRVIQARIQDGWYIENQDRYVQEDIQDAFSGYLVSIKKESDWYTITLSENYTILERFLYGTKECIIGEGITVISDHAKRNSSLLERITFPNSLKSIGENAFSFCDNLTNVTIPDNVTTIGNNAFCNCTNLRTVTIGSSVSEIGISAFWGTSKDVTIYCKPQIPPAQRASFYNTVNLKIYVPNESVDLYKDSWSEYREKIIGTNLY